MELSQSSLPNCKDVLQNVSRLIQRVHFSSIIVDDESHVEFKGMLFLNGYLESILLCLELLRTVDKIGIQAHRNQMHF